MKQLGLSIALCAVVACSSQGTANNKRMSGLAAANAGPGQSNDAKSLASGESTAPKVTHPALLALVAKYEDCAKQGKAWIPQTDSAKVAENPAGDCGADVVKFCCSLAGLEALPGAPADLAGHVQALLDKKFQIYQCSQEAADQVKIHLIKFDGAAVSYTPLTLSGLRPSDPAKDAASCQKPDIHAALQSTGEAGPKDAASAANGGSAVAANGASAGKGQAASAAPAADAPPPAAAGDAAAPVAAFSFAANIDPILSASCGGAACHGDTASQPVYVGNEATTKAAASAIIERLNNGTMPAGGKTISAADKASLIKFLTP